MVENYLYIYNGRELFIYIYITVENYLYIYITVENYLYIYKKVENYLYIYIYNGRELFTATLYHVTRRLCIADMAVDGNDLTDPQL